MRVHRVVPALIAWLAIPLGAQAGNPIPGVGIVVKHCSGPAAAVQHHCKSATRVIAPAGFFGPGSAAVDELVTIDGRCAHACGGCDNDCAGMENDPDGRIDYESDGDAGPFEMILPPTHLYSEAPIVVDVGGVPTSFDVWVSIRGPGPVPDEPVGGMLMLPGGGSLAVGTSSQVASSFLDLHTTTTFTESLTGRPPAAPSRKTCTSRSTSRQNSR